MLPCGIRNYIRRIVWLYWLLNGHSWIVEERRRKEKNVELIFDGASSEWCSFSRWWFSLFLRGARWEGPSTYIHGKLNFLSSSSRKRAVYIYIYIYIYIYWCLRLCIEKYFDEVRSIWQGKYDKWAVSRSRLEEQFTLFFFFLFSFVFDFSYEIHICRE